MPALCVMAELRLRVMRYGWVEGPRYALCLSAHNAAWGRVDEWGEEERRTIVMRLARNGS